MTDFVKEVEDDLKQKQLEKLWQSYGNWVIGAAIAIVVAVAANVGWQSVETSRRASEAASFEQALMLAEEGKTEEAMAQLGEIAGDVSSGYAVLAEFQKAALALQNDKAADALAIYETIENNKSYDDLYRELAGLYGAMHALDQKDLSEEKANAMLTKLQAMSAADKPWRFTAMEMAALYHAQLGHDEEAYAVLADLARIPETPATIKSRAEKMMSVIGAPASLPATAGEAPQLDNVKPASSEEGENAAE